MSLASCWIHNSKGILINRRSLSEHIRWWRLTDQGNIARDILRLSNAYLYFDVSAAVAIRMLREYSIAVEWRIPFPRVYILF